MSEANAALRSCAMICWRNRALLNLSPAEREQALVAWMAVGSPAESEAASEALAALRAAEAMQLKFDSVLLAPRKLS